MKRGIILASFGTSYEETRRRCIESVENKIKAAYKEDYIIRAFTSQVIINKLKRRDGLNILNVEEAIEKMKAEGIEDIYIQPLHIILGHEYSKLLSLGVKVGKPLLDSDEDYNTIVEDLDIGRIEKDQAVIFMGHGTYHKADSSYKKLQEAYRDKGKDNVYIGTVEGSITIEDIIEELLETDIRRVRLMPFMLVAGDHAINDMASEEEDSWKSILESKGFQVEVELKGLGEYRLIQNLYLRHLDRLLEEN